jgi:ferritin
MITEKITKALNDQINAELYSHYLYLSMAAYFEEENLRGFAKWMRKQAGEEMVHGMKIYEHIVDRNARVVLQKIDAPPLKWGSALAAFEDAYKHECEISKKINNIVTMAIAENDHATNVYFGWFVSEQVEEESQSLEIVNQLKMIGESKGGLLALDHHMGKRQ